MSAEPAVARGGSDPRRSPGDHWYRYRHGLMRSGLTVCTFMLTGAAACDGGFTCIPGSHKSNFIDRIPPEVRRFERRPHRGPAGKILSMRRYGFAPAAAL